MTQTLGEEDVMDISILNELIFAECNSQTPIEPHDTFKTTKGPVDRVKLSTVQLKVIITD